jgi:hypothetical protein
MSVQFCSKQVVSTWGTRRTDRQDCNRIMIPLSNNLQFSKVQKLPPITQIAGTCVCSCIYPLHTEHFVQFPHLTASCHTESRIINTKSSMQDWTIPLCFIPSRATLRFQHVRVQRNTFACKLLARTSFYLNPYPANVENMVSS